MIPELVFTISGIPTYGVLHEPCLTYKYGYVLLSPVTIVSPYRGPRARNSNRLLRAGSS